MAKKVESPPDWLKSEGLWDLYSVSGCISKYFCDYIPHWKHNGFWLFDSPAEITAVAAAEFLNMLDQTIFYYEVYENQFDDARVWQPFQADKSFKTEVRAPKAKKK